MAGPAPSTLPRAMKRLQLSAPADQPVRHGIEQPNQRRARPTRIARGERLTRLGERGRQDPRDPIDDVLGAGPVQALLAAEVVLQRRDHPGIRRNAARRGLQITLLAEHAQRRGDDACTRFLPTRVTAIARMPSRSVCVSSHARLL